MAPRRLSAFRGGARPGVHIHSPALEAMHRGEVDPNEVFVGAGRLKLGDEASMHRTPTLDPERESRRAALLAQVDAVAAAQGGGSEMAFPQRDENL